MKKRTTVYRVCGMNCAACQSRVEKAVSGLAGVEEGSVDLLTGKLLIKGDAAPDAVIAAVEGAGYGCRLRDDDTAPMPEAEQSDKAEARATLRRLIASLLLLLPLMYLSMGHLMWGLPLPAFFSGNPLAIALSELLLSLSVLLLNRRFFLRGLPALLRRAPNMDTLIAIGSLSAFLYSLFHVFWMTRYLSDGNLDAATEALHGIYFEAAAMILTLITIGKLLEARAKGKATSALRRLILMAPKTACLLRDGEEVTVPASEVREGDRFLVRPGDYIPVDGIVESGEAAVNEAALTGESMPVNKSAGCTVSAATVNTYGVLTCRATRVGKDTAYAEIIRTVEEASATKAPIAKTADRVAAVFVPAVLLISAVTLLVWLLIGADFGEAIAHAISVLVISCPCALGLATPVAITVGSGIAAGHGIFFKTAAALEGCGRIKTVVLDKTGTVTEGMPAVTELLPASGVTEDELLRLALALEYSSEHPLAAAIVTEAKKKGLTPTPVSGFSALVGSGVTATLDGETLTGGSLRLLESITVIEPAVSARAAALAECGQTPIFFARGDRFLGAITVADRLKEDSRAAVAELKSMHLRVVMLTGDNRSTAAAIAAEAGISELFAERSPSGKEATVRRLMQDGPVMMIGDGLNDAPALTRADIGAALGAGTDIAIDAADVVLVKSTLMDAVAAIRLARAGMRRIFENLFFAFFYNALCIPLAAGVFAFMGLTVSPMLGAAAMSLSSLSVVMNTLRLYFFRPYPTVKPEHTIIQKETTVMTKTLTVEGMMCPHCSGRVKTVLEALPEVQAADVSHESGTAVVTLASPLDDSALRTAVEAAGYSVTAVK